MLLQHSGSEGLFGTRVFDGVGCGEGFREGDLLGGLVGILDGF